MGKDGVRLKLRKGTHTYQVFVSRVTMEICG